MGADTDRILATIGGRQLGLVTRLQAYDGGITRSQLRRRVAMGRLVEVRHGVLALPGAPSTPARAILAACLAARPDAVASHRSAARLWGVELAGDTIDVSVPRGHNPRLEGVHVHHTRDALDFRPVRRGLVPCTNPLRILVELGAVAPIEDVATVLEQFLIDGLVSMPAVRAARQRHARKGRAGVGVLGIVLDGRALGERPPDSILETRMAELLQHHGLGAAVFHHVVRAGRFRAELDFAFVTERVDVEVDGIETHGRLDAFTADRERDATLAGLGWVVVRLTWLQVVRQPAGVARRLAAVLTTRRAA